MSWDVNFRHDGSCLHCIRAFHIKPLSLVGVVVHARDLDDLTRIAGTARGCHHGVVTWRGGLIGAHGAKSKRRGGAAHEKDANI
jgi:hypothetical protein